MILFRKPTHLYNPQLKLFMSDPLTKILDTKPNDICGFGYNPTPWDGIKKFKVFCADNSTIEAVLTEGTAEFLMGLLEKRMKRKDK